MTDWEEHYRHRDTPWDKGAPAPPLVDWLAVHPILGKILVPGCGLGHDVRLLAGQPQARVIGFDLSPSAVQSAEAIPPADGESYRTGDLFHLPAEMIGRFDWVVEHTCFCAIDPARRSDYVEAVHLALKPAGHLLAIFYHDPHDPGDDRTGPPFGTSQEELVKLFSPRFEKLDEFRPGRSYRGREGRELVQLLKKRAD